MFQSRYNRLILWFITETRNKKNVHVLEADVIILQTKKKKQQWFVVSSRKDALDVFQMTTIVLVSVINHYHINGLLLFWDTLYYRWKVKFVAERTLYFCLARNLIWPLGSPNISTQSGWLVLFSTNHLSKQHQKKIEENPRNTLFLKNLQ